MAPITSATGQELNRYCSNTDNTFLVIFGILIGLLTVLLLGAIVEAYWEHRWDSVINVLFQIVEEEDVQKRDNILHDLCAKNCGIYQGIDGAVCLQWMNKLAGVERVAERARKLVAEELANKIQSSKDAAEKYEALKADHERKAEEERRKWKETWILWEKERIERKERRSAV